MNDKQGDQTGLFARLLAEHPGSILDWLGEIDAWEHRIPAGFNWLGLAETAADHARTSDTESLEWARVAVGLYDRLAREVEGARTFGEDSAMMLRAAMVGRFGPAHGDPVLDPDIVLQWFTDAVRVSLPDAEASVARWQRLDSLERSAAYGRELALVRELRKIKNRLGAVDRLSRVKGVTLTDDLNQWLTLRQHLP